MATKKKGKKKGKKRRNNPSAISRSRGFMSGLSVKSSVKNSIPMVAGMFLSKFVGKRFGGGGDTLDADSWTARTFLQMGLGAVGAGVIGNFIKPGFGQKAMDGATAKLIFDILNYELVLKNETMRGLFGQDDDDYDLQYEELPLEGWGVDDSYRYDLPELPEGMEGELEPVGRLGFGDVTLPTSRLGDDPLRQALYADYRNAYDW